MILSTIVESVKSLFTKKAAEPEQEYIPLDIPAGIRELNALGYRSPRTESVVSLALTQAAQGRYVAAQVTAQEVVSVPDWNRVLDAAERQAEINNYR